MSGHFTSSGHATVEVGGGSNCTASSPAMLRPRVIMDASDATGRHLQLRANVEYEHRSDLNSSANVQMKIRKACPTATTITSKYAGATEKLVPLTLLSDLPEMVPRIWQNRRPETTST